MTDRKIITFILITGMIWLPLFTSCVRAAVTADPEPTPTPSSSQSPVAAPPPAATEPATPKPAPTTETPKPKPVKTYRVSNVVDGDTITLSSGQKVRLIGIDTPERGQCNYERATRKLEQLVEGRRVYLVKGARDNTDRYGRWLRYVDVGSKDAGARLISTGLAKPRYNSTDGYGEHDREKAYAKLYKNAADAPSCPKPKPEPQEPERTREPSVYYENCTAARDAGAAPVRRGDPGYGDHLDRDGDGVGCE